MGCQALGGSLEESLKAWRLLMYFEKKIKTKFLKVMTFLLKATGHVWFLILTKLFLAATNFTARLA